MTSDQISKEEVTVVVQILPAAHLGTAKTGTQARKKMYSNVVFKKLTNFKKVQTDGLQNVVTKGCCLKSNTNRQKVRLLCVEVRSATKNYHLVATAATIEPCHKYFVSYILN